MTLRPNANALNANALNANALNAKRRGMCHSIRLFVRLIRINGDGCKWRWVIQSEAIA
jgi:hypothetical protein